MSERIKQKLGFVVAAAMVLAGVAVLNVGAGASTAAATECEPDGGSGGGESPSPSGSASPSPSESETEEPFPPTLPPIVPSESESESPSASPSESEGQARRCESEITINYRGPNRQNPERREFSGRVRSDEDACESGRKVLLKKKRPGRDKTVDTTVTNDRGTWRVPVRRANGRYYAQTPQERVASDQGRVTCGAARSTTIKV